MKQVIRLLCVLAIGWISLIPSTGFAQVGWLNPEGKPGVQFEFTTTNFKDDSFLSAAKFPTGSLFLTGRGILSPNVDWLVELPMFFTKTGGMNYFEVDAVSKFGIANPYSGIEWAREGTSTIFTLGVRIPIISGEKANYALPAYFTSPHRFLAYYNKVMIISAGGGFRYVDPSGFGMRITACALMAVPHLIDVEAELFGDVVTNFWYQSRRVRVGAGLNYMDLLTKLNFGSVDQRLVTVNTTLDIDAGNWRPGVHIQIPISKYLTDEIGLIYGLHLSYYFPAVKD